MTALPIAFLSPWILLALFSLPVIWWLLKLTPPKPQEEVFPPTRILARLAKAEETPAQSPWWLTLLRLLMAALIILAMAQPILNPQEEKLGSNDTVALIMDDGWASASNWETRKNTALQLIQEAGDNDQPVILLSTIGRKGWDGVSMPAEQATSLIDAAESLAIKPFYEVVTRRVKELAGENTIGHLVWMSDGIAHEGTNDFLATIDSIPARKSVYTPQTGQLVVMGGLANELSSLSGKITRLESADNRELNIIARDKDGLILARTSATFDADSREAGFSFDQPVELRNQITRVQIEEINHAGAVQLLDENNRRRLIGLISGEKHDLAQPLLSPLFYISRALEPFSDLRRSEDANVTVSVPQLISQGVSAIMLADVGLLGVEAAATLEDWVEKGGVLVRFSGPRLAASPTGKLLPVDIRPGDRNLGGALSWESPKPLAVFERSSPFFGIDPPRDVLVKKQLLALQESKLEEKTWATLEDGTPLVTAQKRKNGWIVLFHVGSDASWSNLPLSGTFVEMLRRIVNLSKSTVQTGNENQELSLPPFRILDGKGNFTAPDISVKPLILDSETKLQTSLENPPGLYGTQDGYEALNLFGVDPKLTALETNKLPGGFDVHSYVTEARFEFRPWLLLAGACLLLVDCLIVLWMAGALRFMRKTPVRATGKAGLASIAATIMVISILSQTPPAHSQETDFSASLRTRLAYVVTGVADVDRISKAGMEGLTVFLTNRTALEPAKPIGLDISTDELSFYSLLYWPIDPAAEIPDAQTMARIDNYMKQGGSIIFDTKDQISGIFGGTSVSPASRTLQLILSSLDIPALEPVPSDHVLTKAFYLLDSFPGRFAGGDLWVETSQETNTQEGRPARAGDGVSSILITSNDLAGAWAVDQNLRPLLPTIPSDPAQRNYAFRAGVNLMMYALTGNYKADQVHLPALLERLGQ